MKHVESIYYRIMYIVNDDMSLEKDKREKILEILTEFGLNAIHDSKIQEELFKCIEKSIT